MKNTHDKLDFLKDEMKNTNRSHLRFASLNAFRYQPPSKSQITEDIQGETTAGVLQFAKISVPKNVFHSPSRSKKRHDFQTSNPQTNRQKEKSKSESRKPLQESAPFRPLEEQAASSLKTNIPNN